MTASGSPARAYLDWNAAAPLMPAAAKAMRAAMMEAGNPSSVHGEGRTARRIVEDARAAVAEACGARPAQVIFTSGGTEANALALSPLWTHAPRAPFARLIVSAIEHPAVLAGGRFASDAVEIVPVRADGVVDLAALEAMLANGAPALVAIMFANNETGILQPATEAAAIVHRYGGLLHVDAVQALGKVALDIRHLMADSLAMSAHKIGGPKGVGALVLADAARGPDPAQRGGGQERGHRAGTENVVGIAGFGAAAKALHPFPAATGERMARLRDRLEAGLRELTPGVTFFGEGLPRLPNTSLMALPGLLAETAVIAFDLEGIAVSSGAACSSGKVQPSHVLAAMGVPDRLARGAIRFSLGPDTPEEAILRCLEAWRSLSGTLVK